MIDITRNIVVTSENAEEVLLELRKEMSAVKRMLVMLNVNLDPEARRIDEQRGWSAASNSRIRKIQNLIDRIELVKGDLHKNTNSRFHTIPEDKFRCQDCAAFGFTTMWKDKHGYWELPEFGYRARSVLVPVKVSLDI